MVDSDKRSGFWAAGFGGANATGIAVVERAQKQALEVNLVDLFGLAAQGHRLARERFADGTQTALPLDLPVVADLPHDPAAPVTDGLRSAVTPTAAMVVIGGITSCQPFVWTREVVVASPAITALLLTDGVGRRRAGGVAFEFAMHLFMRGVLLRMAWANKLDANAQRDPPHTQGREAPRASAAEGRAVVHADDLGQAVAAEQAYEHAAHRGKPLVREDADGQEKAAERSRTVPSAVRKNPLKSTVQTSLGATGWVKGGKARRGPRREWRGRRGFGQRVGSHWVMVRTAGQ